MQSSCINPVILVGGTGTRLWPLSRVNYPKQFIRLDGQYSLFQQTVLRVKKIQNVNCIYIVVNESNYFLCLDQLRDCHAENVTIIVEPAGRNTAPAAAAAAHIMKQRNAYHELMLVLPSDHKIKNDEEFIATISQAISANTEKKLILFGIKPHEPSTAYGYIQTEHDAAQLTKVKSFFEKPSLDNAKIFISQSNCYWNSGMFLFSAETFLAELSHHAPDINSLGFLSTENGIHRDNTYYLNRDDFSKMSNISIDVAVMEKTNAAYVLALQSDWSDLGDWHAIHKNAEADQNGNVSVGNVFSLDTQNSYLHSDDKLLATLGVDNLVVVASKDSVLIANKSKAQDVKVLVNLLKSQGHGDCLANDLKVHRPWGTYESIMTSKNVRVKHIIVKPGGKLSLQLHAHRSEHWVVVKGIADVVCAEKSFQLYENESIYILKNTKHRLSNLQDRELHLIEVQVGDYVGEDDIVRFDDVYGRVSQSEKEKVML
ncbi:MAG TPA: mannose-1-phosphate guanylyltransferase/mannose-6-phosphate isomerase [Coxiellaceae bacterium]|nr:MAG: mannose-1-phosphate guanylyltransferase/mannose-6-phosphate isomerase [Gammaproteobacteria bacterium RIFCSPHIGHO2_12_FULL_36_30]HLB56496.1 mannose-1-phosphate guanylyltransferase/mannose-6-phosphate isomerase [Coxiellaceae bacterium]